MGFVLGRIIRLELDGRPPVIEEVTVDRREEDPVETAAWERMKRGRPVPPSERRFDARIAALEAVARIAAKDEEPAVILSVAEQLEDWLMRPGPAEEAEPRVVVWADEARSWKPPWARGA